MMQAVEERSPWTPAWRRDSSLAAGIGEDWLAPVRRAAGARFEQLGVPTVRQEAWRFTNLAPMLREGLQPAAPQAAGSDAEGLLGSVPRLGGPRLVFVNGFYAAALSEPASPDCGARVMSLREALAAAEPPAAVRQHLAQYAHYDDHPFTALNTELMADGALVHVPAAVELDAPIHLVFLGLGGARPLAWHLRNLIVVDAGAAATIVETHWGAPSALYLSNVVTELIAGAGARVEHCKTQREAERAYHVARVQIEQHESSDVGTHLLSMGGRIARNDMFNVLDGAHARARVNGLFMARGLQLADVHTRIEHVSPQCDSRELFKGILDGRARGVFDGRIHVHPGAQKTDARQTNRNLLLSDDATVHTNPQLEIYADDVKCTHGATTGQLEPAEVFYLRSRGIDRAAAESMLIRAFAEDVLRHVRAEPVRAAGERLVRGWLAQVGLGG